jgi:DNA-binding transcriptional regulator GbsR (MarR family)
VAVASLKSSVRTQTDRSPELSWQLVRHDSRPADVVAFEESVVVFFLETATVLGVPKSLAAIYGILFASPMPLSFSEVKERLDISAGSISQGLRVLREVGAVKVITTKLDSREFFTPDMELRKLVARYLEKRVEAQLDSGRTRLKAIGHAVPAGDAKSTEVLTIRLKQLQTWHDKARAVLPIAKTFLKLT